MTPHPIRCRCGKFQGQAVHPERGVRAVCYCKDCQAFAHFLELPPGMLDAAGGTEIVAIQPGFVSFDRGVELLTCMSLSPKGTLRWYTRCCGTPIGNTARNIKLPHIGLIHTCLEQEGADLGRSFGPVRMRVNRQSAKTPVRAAPIVGFVATLARYLASAAWSRVSGRYRRNAFFEGATGAPIQSPRVLTPAERAAFTPAN